MLQFRTILMIALLLGMCPHTDAQSASSLASPTLSKSQQNAGLVNNISSTTGKSYTLTNLAVNTKIYTDREYETTSVPAALAGADMIRTANDDKWNTSEKMLSFELSEKGTVIVAYDPRGKKLPAWLSGWYKLPVRLGVNDSKINQVHLYGKEFPAGKVSLGGNMFAPAAGAQNNYFVLVSEKTQESVIKELTTSTNKVYILSELLVGVNYYTDRSYEVLTVPGHLNGLPFIKVPNDDKKSTSARMLSFELTQPATLYIAYDPRATALPAWMQGWQKLPEKIGVNDSKITHMELYSKEFQAGTVMLGGNMNSPAAGAMSNYFVVIKAANSTEENIKLRRSLQLYPNPNAGASMHIDLKNFGSGEKVIITVYDLLGQPLHTVGILTNEEGAANTELVFEKKMNTGVYLLRAKSAAGYLQKKLIVN